MTLGWAGSDSRVIDCTRRVHITFHLGAQPHREQLSNQQLGCLCSGQRRSAPLLSEGRFLMSEIFFR